MPWIDWAFPFWRPTWELFVLVPYHRIRSWWWKRNHPIEYMILKAFVEVYEAKVERQGDMFPDLVPDPERRMRMLLYGDIALQEAARSKITVITDVS